MNKILDVKNPRYADPENKTIDLDIKWQNSNEYSPFTASPSDPEEYGRALFESARSGDYGDIAPFDHDAFNQQQEKQKIKVAIRKLETEIAPLRDEALAGIISDDDRKTLASLITQSKTLRQRLT